MDPQFVVPPGAAASHYSHQPGSTSVWLMTLTENMHGKIALANGDGLVVSSNDASVVPNGMGVSKSGKLAIFDLYGRTTGTTMLDARGFDGSVAAYVQVRVDPLGATMKHPRMIRLKTPYAVLNAPNVTPISGTHVKTVPWDWSADKMLGWVPSDSKHLVFSCHGFHTGRKADFPVVHMSIGTVLGAANVGAFDVLMAAPNLRVIWIAACSLAGEGPGDAWLSEMARRSGCYVVGASADTADRSPAWGCVEDSRYAMPKYFDPAGGGKMVSRGDFFSFGAELGFNIVA